MTREDLEIIKAVVEKEGDAAEIPKGYSEEAIEQLGGAAPALALAVIEARRVFGLQMGDGDRGERASLEPVIEQLDAALAYAGVES